MSLNYLDRFTINLYYKFDNKRLSNKQKQYKIRCMEYINE